MFHFPSQVSFTLLAWNLEFGVSNWGGLRIRWIFEIRDTNTFRPIICLISWESLIWLCLVRKILILKASIGVGSPIQRSKELKFRHTVQFSESSVLPISNSEIEILEPKELKSRPYQKFDNRFKIWTKTLLFWRFARYFLLENLEASLLVVDLSSCWGNDVTLERTFLK